MNKAQKEVQQTQLNNEKNIIKLLKRVYEQARKDCENKIKQLSSRTDFENLQSIIYQKQYQEALKKQLEGILDNLQSEEFTSITDYLQKSYHNGYAGVMYDLAKQGIPLIMPINQNQVVKALQTDSKLSKGLYARLGEDVNYLKRSIRAELSRGIASGSTWNEMAGKIAKGMNSPFNTSINNAIRIARTEGHRVQQSAALDAQYRAKEKGADIVKQWDSTLDNRTRPHHRMLDGQIRELDEDFEIEGMTASAPGHFGRAKEDINCRCCLLQRARWALDEDELNELKERAASFGLDKTKDFEEFKKKYLSASGEEIKKQISDVKSELEKEMLFGNNPKKVAALKQQYDSLVKNSGITISKKSTHSPSKGKTKIVNVDFSAMSLDELKDYANSSLQTEFVGFSGANADYIREAVKVMDKFEKMKSGTIKGLKVKFGGTPSGVYAKYDDTTNTILLKKTGSMKAFEQKQLEDNIRYKFKWKTNRDYYATTTFSGTVAHELGHAVDFDTNQSLSRALSATEELDELSVKISSYAATTQNVRVSKRSEAWAENFAAYMEGGEKAKEVPEEIIKMIKDYFSKGRV